MENQTKCNISYRRIRIDKKKPPKTALKIKCLFTFSGFQEMLHVDKVDSLQTEKVNIRASGLVEWSCYTFILR